MRLITLEKVLCRVVAAFGFVAPVWTISMVSGIVTQLGGALNDTQNVSWLISGWSVAGAVSFSIAGSFSDIFGRRFVILLCQFLTIVSCVCSLPIDRFLALWNKLVRAS
ncbi:hypothetical protein EDB81DRAFT_834158 [Dactylonectria macrodidyma]|uniref:Major facilitator superfamily (MFS) profile domain-containing protein n=1 Tax=Dactylonectria macrodidyma TaxID=307937 RepID=A0A9P9CYF1_9HYPO|nr:hypothetical protein EDB81DRAFT_834158 [Dactylonectria macrodidyma]